MNAIHKLSAVLEKITTSIQDPNSTPGTQFIAEGEKLMKQRLSAKRGKNMIVFGALLLIAASIAIGLFSGGVLAPFSVAGIAIGTLLIAAAASGGASAAAGFGLRFWSSNQSKALMNASRESLNKDPNNPPTKGPREA